MSAIAPMSRSLVEDSYAPVSARDDMVAAGEGKSVRQDTAARLVTVVSGTLTMTVNDRLFAMARDRGLWLPAGTAFTIVCRTAVRLRTIRFEGEVGPMPKAVRPLDLSSLVRALVQEIASHHARDGDGAGRSITLSRLLIRELATLPERPVRVTLPRDPRLRRVCEAIVAHPSDDRCIDEWSREAGMARRTFTQSFRDQTGMAFAGWRRQVRLVEAAERIAAGQPIGRVAYDLGYESSSAFTAMFRRTLGAPPRVLLRGT